MSRVTYGNEETGGITVIVEDIDNINPDEHSQHSPRVSAGRNQLKDKDDNSQRTDRKRGSVTVSTFFYTTCCNFLISSQKCQRKHRVQTARAYAFSGKRLACKPVL